MENKKASFILVSRDDNYCGDSVGRLNNTINFLGERLESLGKLKFAECILVEWGTKTLKKKLSLNKSIKKILKIVEVPKNITEKYQKDSPFSEVHAMNTGFRESVGEFFIRIDQDTLVGDRFIEWFFDEYHRNKKINWPKIAFSGRRDLSIEESIKFKDIILNEDLNKKIPITHENNYFDKNIYGRSFKFYGAAVGAIIIHRTVYEIHKGFNEKLVYMNNMDVEFINRICKKEKIYNLGLKLENDFYHQYHSRRDAAIFRDKNGNRHGKRKTNDLKYRKNKNYINRNRESEWGLMKENLNIISFL